MVDPTPAVLQKLREHFEKHDLEIHFRLRNDQLLYTMIGRPPVTSGITEGALATAMVHAWQNLEFKVAEKRDKDKRLTRTLLGGSEITYPDFVSFSWREGHVESTRKRGVASKVLNGVFADLMKAAKETAPSQGELN